MEADKAAMQATRTLLAATIAFYERRGPEPTLREGAHAAALREAADRLYRAAMNELEEAAVSIRGQWSEDDKA